MTRAARLVIPGLPHHVVLRGNNKRRLFSYPREYQHFVFLMARASLTSGTAVHSAVLMANHVHLVVTPPRVDGLARFVKPIAQRYAQLRNAQRDSCGRLFEQRYFSKPIVDERQLAVTLAYVELNPVRAGLADDPADYRWSTYHCHAGAEDGGIPRSICSPTEWYASLAPTEPERWNAYREWAAACRDRGSKPVEATKLELRAAMTRLSSTEHVERRPDRRAAT